MIAWQTASMCACIPPPNLCRPPDNVACPEAPGAVQTLFHRGLQGPEVSLVQSVRLVFPYDVIFERVLQDVEDVRNGKVSGCPWAPDREGNRVIKMVCYVISSDTRTTVAITCA